MKEMNSTLEHMMMMDRLALNTWPAEHTEPMGNWLLRTSGGITKRANSVFTLYDFPAEPGWLERIETFYHELQQPVYFQVSDASPTGLDAILEQHGYEKQIPCWLMTAQAEECKKLAADYGARKEITVTAKWHPFATENWIEHFMQFEKFTPEKKDFYTGLLGRIEPVKGFVELQVNEQTVAVATAVVENGWAGFVNVIVSEDSRGQGLGHQLMQALAAWSLEQGAKNLYLQVIADNIPAVKLYQRVGFTQLYGYHYRMKL
jgi:GNAT superfamily N-acetyltransferase